MQDGILDSNFLWELSRSGELTGRAFNNDVVGDWTYATTTSDAAFQLIAAAPEPASLAPLLACAAVYVRRRRRR